MPRPHQLSAAGLAALDTMTRIGEEVAAPAADAVDATARFPKESIDALRAAGLLGALVPVSHGGMGCTYADVAALCTEFGKYCGSSAMVFAMHQIQVACVVEHGLGIAHFDQLAREVASPGRLLGSATTELGIGGDLGSSICAVEYDGGRFSLVKQASVISYGNDIDDVMVTARRDGDSPASDQVILHAQKPYLDLEPMEGGQWDTLGMRGTDSVGFVLKATGSTEQIFPKPYADISARTMVPVTHSFWSSVWLGLAEGALDKARAYVRAAARKNPGTQPPAAPLLAAATARLESIRVMIDACIDEYERSRQDPEVASAMGFAIRMGQLKMYTSEQVVGVILDALSICGIAGYRNDGAYSVARPLRDALSASIMVHNDRIRLHNGALLCVAKEV